MRGKRLPEVAGHSREAWPAASDSGRWKRQAISRAGSLSMQAPTIMPPAPKLRSSANLLLVSAVGYGGLASRTLQKPCWNLLSGSPFSGLDHLNLLQCDETGCPHSDYD